LLHFPSRWPST